MTFIARNCIINYIRIRLNEMFHTLPVLLILTSHVLKPVSLYLIRALNWKRRLGDDLMYTKHSFFKFIYFPLVSFFYATYHFRLEIIHDFYCNYTCKRFQLQLTQMTSDSLRVHEPITPGKWFWTLFLQWIFSGK